MTASPMGPSMPTWRAFRRQRMNDGQIRRIPLLVDAWAFCAGAMRVAPIPPRISRAFMLDRPRPFRYGMPSFLSRRDAQNRNAVIPLQHALFRAQ